MHTGTVCSGRCKVFEVAPWIARVAENVVSTTRQFVFGYDDPRVNVRSSGFNTVAKTKPNKRDTTVKKTEAGAASFTEMAEHTGEEAVCAFNAGGRRVVVKFFIDDGSGSGRLAPSLEHAKSKAVV